MGGFSGDCGCWVGAGAKAVWELWERGERTPAGLGERVGTAGGGILLVLAVWRDVVRAAFVFAVGGAGAAVWVGFVVRFFGLGRSLGCIFDCEEGAWFSWSASGCELGMKVSSSIPDRWDACLVPHPSLLVRVLFFRHFLFSMLFSQFTHLPLAQCLWDSVYAHFQSSSQALGLQGILCSKFASSFANCG